MKTHLYNNKKIEQKHGKSVWDFAFNLKFIKKLQPKVSLEIGVWKGSTFQILHKYSKNAIGIDNLTWTYKDSYPKEWNIKIMDSKDLTTKDLNFNKIDFAHIDGSHKFQDVVNDFEFVKNNIANDGIICIDDFITHRDVFVATNYFLRNNKNFFIKFYGYNQVYITTVLGAKKIEDIVNQFSIKDKKLYKLENTYTMNVVPKNDAIDLSVIPKIDENINEDLIKFYKEFNR